MSWCDGSDENYDLNLERASNTDHPSIQLKDQSQSCVTSRPDSKTIVESPIMTCSSCGHKMHQQDDQVMYINHWFTSKKLPSQYKLYIYPILWFDTY